MSLLAVERLRTWFDVPGGRVRAVDGVDFEIRRGECFALVGESGCGKSVTALSLLRLLPEAGRIVDGAARLEGRDLFALPEAAMRAVRGRRVAMIFQEPATSLNPVLTVGRQIVGERVGAGPADALRTAGHQRAFALKIEFHRPTSLPTWLTSSPKTA